MKVEITFSNNEKIYLKEGDILIPLVKTRHKDNETITQSYPYEIWYHLSAGFVPSATEFLSNCEFFQVKENDSIAYSSANVVSIKNVD